MTRETKTFIALIAMHALGDCYGGVWPMFKKLENIDLAFAGLVGTATIFVGQGLQPIFGILSDHGRQRQFILWGTALTCASMLIGAVSLAMNGDDLNSSGPYALMFVIMLIARFGQGLFHPAGASVAGNVSHHRRSTIVAIFIMFGMMGMAMSQWIYSVAYHQLGGHTYWMLGPAVLIVLGGVIWCRPEEHTTDRRVQLRKVFEALKPIRGQLFTLYLFQMSVAFLANGVIFLMPEFMEAKMAPSWFVNGGGLILWIGGSVLLMTIGGHLSDSRGRLMVFRWATLIAVTLYFIMLLVPVPLYLFLILLTATGGFLGMTNPLGIVLGQQLAPRQYASVVSGIMMGAAWGLGSFANLTVGVLADMESIGVIHALAIAGAMCIVTVTAAFLIREPKTAPAVLDNRPGK